MARALAERQARENAPSDEHAGVSAQTAGRVGGKVLVVCLIRSLHPSRQAMAPTTAAQALHRFRQAGGTDGRVKAAKGRGFEGRMGGLVK